MNDIEVRINKEVRDYQEGIFFGLTLRQFLCAFGAVAVALAVYFFLGPALGGSDVGWACVLAAAPFALCGFYRYNSMTFEQFILAVIRSELLYPKRLVFKSDHLYTKALENATILLYDTGARVQELADLDIESLHLDVPNPYISIIGKGRKRRNVPIMRKTVAHLNSYLKEFHPSEQSAPLFYSMRDGKPHRLSTDSISLVVGTAAKMARETCNAVPENVHCHLFRKTKAMDLYKNGIPLPFIMQLLGHESISTTSGFYAFATLEMMSDAINKSVPIIGGTEKLWKNKNAKQALYTLD